MRIRPLLALAATIALVAAGACATYTVVGLDAGEDAAAPIGPPTSTVDAPSGPPVEASVDAGPPVDAADAAVCITCGSECCYAGTSKDYCRFGNVCGACSATANPCRGDIDCCDAGKCTTNANGDGGLCRATCKGKFSFCGSTNECCLGMRCEQNGSLTLCQ